jgi:hypothetical protein
MIDNALTLDSRSQYWVPFIVVGEADNPRTSFYCNARGTAMTFSGQDN